MMSQAEWFEVQDRVRKGAELLQEQATKVRESRDEPIARDLDEMRFILSLHPDFDFISGKEHHATV